MQAVLRDGERTLCFVAAGRRSEPREVEVGRYNELWVQILAGLEEGQTVLMQPPAGFVGVAREEARE